MFRYDTMCQNYKEGLSRLPQMKQKEGTEIRFSVVPEKMYPKNATPAEVTQHSMDLSYALGQLIDEYYPAKPLDILCKHNGLHVSAVCPLHWPLSVFMFSYLHICLHTLHCYLLANLFYLVTCQAAPWSKGCTFYRLKSHMSTKKK